MLLIVIKAGAALLLAQLAWRLVRARRILAAAKMRAPWPRLELSPRLWLTAFWLTSLCYLVQTDAERIATGRWPLLAPWLHTSALPVFAVLAVVVAVLYSLVIQWLHELERTADAVEAAAAALRRLPMPLRAAPVRGRPHPAVSSGSRSSPGLLPSRRSKTAVGRDR